MTAVPRLSWAEAKRNGDFIQVETYSGYGITTFDPLGKQHLLAAGASDDDIGTAVLDCLEHSRFIPPDESPDEDLRSLILKRFSALLEVGGQLNVCLRVQEPDHAVQRNVELLH